ncbi:MAG: hypothetical protein RLZZ470_262 [Pseudomonadota bacterium]
MLLAWLLGAALQLGQPVLWSSHTYQLLLLASAVGMTVLVLLRGHHGLQHGLRLFMLCCTVVGVSFASVGWRAAHFAQARLPANLEGVDLVVTGLVATMPQLHADGMRFQLQVEHAHGVQDQQAVVLPPRIQLAWYATRWDGERINLPQVHAGERWTLATRLKQPHGLVNPGGWDAELWLWEQGVQATGHVRDGAQDPAPQRLQVTEHHLVEQLRQSLRDRIAQEVPQARWAGLIAGLLIGDQAAIERADWDVFRITGIAHLMSISGLHITMWAWVAGGLVWWLWRHSDVWGMSWCLRYPAPWAALWGGLLWAVAYALISGWGLPAQRTVVMLALAGLLRWGAVRWPLRDQWLFAAVGVVLVDPWALLQAGFWLSFVAVGILLLSTPPVVASPVMASPVIASSVFASPVIASAAKQTVGKQSSHLLREQLLISICLAPLTAVLFQQVSIMGLLVNLFAIPWVTLVVTPLAFIGAIWSPIWQLCALCLQALCAVLEPLSQVSWAVWQVAAPPWWAGVIGVVGAGVLAAASRWRWRMTGLCLMLPCFLWPVSRPPPGHVEVIAADIGQGNAVLVRTARHSLLFDTGPRFGSDSDAGQRVLLPLLQTMNERLDTLVLSHQDSDHTGGALSVQQVQAQAQVLTSMPYDHWLAQTISTQRCQSGQQWTWEGVQFDMLHPLAEDYAQVLSPNARSCVLRISAHGQVVLLTADIEAFQEQALVKRSKAQLRADVLLVPHHGSKTSSTEIFLDAVQPRWALFQMAYRNRYGHPAPQVLQRYIERGIAFKLSPSCGAMTWRSDAPDGVACEREKRRRYWFSA